MKFSYSLIKKLGARIPAKEKFIEQFNLHGFEVEDLPGDSLEIKIPANRYSDAASHYGIAVLASAMGGKTVPVLKSPKLKPVKKSKKFIVDIQARKFCARYSGLYAEVKKITSSPKWLQDTLVACGLRPINNVVDVMNYVMLETGQPLHAFDFDLLHRDPSGAARIVVRNAKAGEYIMTIDRDEHKLNPTDYVIADDKQVLAIAGVKGGSRAEVNGRTRRIVIEAASFDGPTIYKTSRALNLLTDASGRFNHGLSPALIDRAILRAAALLKEVCEATIGDWVDVEIQKPKKTALKFNYNQFVKLTGLMVKPSDCLKYLKNLGFAVKGKLVTVPPERTDIAIPEDLTEEIINLYGYAKLPAVVPHLALIPSGLEDQITLKDKLRKLLVGLGLSEVYNYSFVARKATIDVPTIWQGKAISLRNPVSAEFQYLRPSLAPYLLKNATDNLRFYDEARVFEIGKIFPGENQEVLALGIAVNAKKSNLFLELKGIVDSLFRAIGVADAETVSFGDGLKIEAGNATIGYLRPTPKGSVAELDLGVLVKIVSEERAYRPMPKYPSIIRDISLIVDAAVRVGDIQNLIENASELLEDVDLVDWYEDPKLGDEKKSLTFRLIFQSEERTLTDDEVGKEMEKILADLVQKFDAEVR